MIGAAVNSLYYEDRNFFQTMAFENWKLLCSALLLLVFSIGNIDAQSCGGNYTTDYGVFASPNYPNVYGLNSACTYRILLPNNSQISISFDTFELDRSPEDVISMTCESSPETVRTNFSWNINIAPRWMSSCSIGRIDFLSDSYLYFPTRGFKVQYQASTFGCGRTVFTTSSGTISSPNYPQNYDSNENCTYSIWASEASSFTLSFQAFDLESDCRYDWVQIRCDNSSYISPKYCGSTLPKQLNITNCNKVLIWFHTDSSIVSSGFSLQYTFTHDGCGKSDYAGLSGIITSRNYPKALNGRSPTCTYYLYPISSVALAFQAFDLEPFIDDQTGDYVQIYCSTNSGDFSGTFFGNTLPPLISYSTCGRVVINFYNNNVLSGTGFNIRYQVNPLVAHSTITSASETDTVDVGTRVWMSCISDAIDYYPSWTFSRDGTEENTEVLTSYCINIFADPSIYDVFIGGPGVCSLVIKNATLAEAGVYTCIDVGLASMSSVITVVVPSSMSALNDQVIHDDSKE